MASQESMTVRELAQTTKILAALRGCRALPGIPAVRRFVRNWKREHDLLAANAQPGGCEYSSIKWTF